MSELRADCLQAPSHQERCLKASNLARLYQNAYPILQFQAMTQSKAIFHPHIIRIQQWHKDQIIDPVPDATDPDAIDLSLPVHDWTEILGRALRCGANCEVLGPPEFRKLWQEEIKRMVERAKEK